MSISPLFIPLFSIEEVILNKDNGLPLSGGVVKFYRDTQRFVSPKQVYMITGTPPDYTFSSVGNVLTLGISGTFVDVNGNPFVPYAFPYDAAGNVDLYFVTVESSGGVPQFTREAVPYISSGVIPPSERSNTDNELSNPQFVEILFPSATVTTISVTGTNTVTPIAPGWDLITSGTGNVILERLEPIAASIDTNPPYTLRIEADAALGASIALRQRLTNSPSVLRGGFVSGTFLAAVISGGGSAISMTYAPSIGTPTTIIDSTNIPTDGAYHVIAGNIAIPEQVNDPATIGYVDINLIIPTARNIAISSIQIVGVSDSIDIPFDEETAARQKDELFHYYEDSILHQPKENLLVGWNFALNPWQFRSTTDSNVANNTYTADQTIIIQQAYVASATGNNVSVGRGTLSENYPFKIKAVTAANKFAMVQYIDPATIRPYWNQKVSLRANLTLSSPTHSTVCRFKVRLIYRLSLPPTIAQDEPISAWTNVAGSDPTFKAGWTAIAPLNDPIYTISTTANVSYDFNQFQLPPADNAAVNDNMVLGVVIYTLDNMDQTATADSILFNNVSLVHNDFAIDASTDTFDEALRKCQYYYEKSYDLETLPASVTAIGQIAYVAPWVDVGGAASLSRKCFSLNYKQAKRFIPTTTFYSPLSATANRIELELLRTGGATDTATILTSTYTASGESKNSITMTPNTTGEVLVKNPLTREDEGRIRFHYTADSRLGI